MSAALPKKLKTMTRPAKSILAKAITGTETGGFLHVEARILPGISPVK